MNEFTIVVGALQLAAIGFAAGYLHARSKAKPAKSVLADCVTPLRPMPQVHQAMVIHPASVQAIAAEVARQLSTPGAN